MDIFSSMGSLQGSAASWNLSAMLKTSGISMDVQRHLVQVYAALSACVLSAAIACGAVILLSPVPPYMSEWAGWLGMLSFVGATGGTIWLHMEPLHNFQRRVGILMMISAAMGISLSTLVAVTLEVDPSILITAFLMTTTVFLCFTGSALLATRRSYLYLGGVLSSALSTMLVMNILNIFFRSTMLYAANLYLGLAVFCAYVIFDTQMIIEKASLGDKDSLKHALDLFLDFVSIFVRILIILLQNSGKKRSNSDSKRSKK
ncbi:hypothetical protein P43SY_008527 [Pythium insidiosum]|uniref:Bax inhibitor-like protein n=1 Tax=Pythium insidiosum TaxID=114742 RepID=A0AAD5M9M2_PYTIN|nr:hypothetical protein P43SY_008527 [Pythium insidiosum]